MACSFLLQRTGVLQDEQSSLNALNNDSATCKERVARPGAVEFCGGTFWRNIEITYFFQLGIGILDFFYVDDTETSTIVCLVGKLAPVVC